MQEFDIRVFVAVLQEMLGVRLCVMSAVAITGIFGFVRVLKRESGINAKRLVTSEVLGIFGGFLALV